MLNWNNWKGNGWSMLVGPILGVIKRERKLINNGLRAAPTEQPNQKPNVLYLLFFHYLHSNGEAKQIAKMAICFLP